MKGIRQAHVEEEEKKKSNVCNSLQEKVTLYIKGFDYKVETKE
jgi:hypothetical protein